MSNQPPHPEQLISVKELAMALGRSESYVWAMRRRGFRFIGGRSTLSAALVFLQRVPNPWSGDIRRKPK